MCEQAVTVPEMTYNVFSGTLIPTHFTSFPVCSRCFLKVKSVARPVFQALFHHVGNCAVAFALVGQEL